MNTETSELDGHPILVLSMAGVLPPILLTIPPAALSSVLMIDPPSVEIAPERTDQIARAFGWTEIFCRAAEMLVASEPHHIDDRGIEFRTAPHELGDAGCATSVAGAADQSHPLVQPRKASAESGGLHLQPVPRPDCEPIDVRIFPEELLERWSDVGMHLDLALGVALG